MHEVMSITGHCTLEEVENYTLAARKPGMADSAMLKSQTSAAKIVPPQIEVGQEDEKVLIKQAHLAALALPRELAVLAVRARFSGLPGGFAFDSELSR